MDQLWADRAASAEAAIGQRHLGRLWWLPGTQLGVVAWPANARYRRFATWHYWWQAHLLDNLVDAQLRNPTLQRRNAIARQIRGHRLRNLGRWTNDYYDDMAWLALALERAGRLAGVSRPTALATLADQFVTAWVPEDGGGIPWRKQDQFFNAPANGPAAIFLVRHLSALGEPLRRALQMADWIDDTLIDPETHLVFDGIKAGSLVRAQYTYCQAVVLGLETELAVHTEDPVHAQRVHRLVAAVAANMAPEGVIKGAGGGDGGLFNGILARYLAFVATTLPQRGPDDERAARTARSLVLASGHAAWQGCQLVEQQPLFSAFWDRPAQVPTGAGVDAHAVDGAVNSSEIAERDLSVQLAGWMLMEAAHTVAGDESGPVAGDESGPVAGDESGPVAGDESETGGEPEGDIDGE